MSNTFIAFTGANRMIYHALFMPKNIDNISGRTIYKIPRIIHIDTKVFFDKNYTNNTSSKTIFTDINDKNTICSTNSI